MISGLAALGLTGIGATIGLPVLYARACRKDKREQETGR
jgi:hypothetical protein